MSLLLLFRSPVGTPYGSYWGDHFPRKSKGHDSHWNAHFPDLPPNTVPGTPPDGVATFALTLESDTQVTFAWRTGVFKSYSGKERRQNLIDDPGMRFRGRALLVGDDLRTARSRIARYAALGRPFQLGLPYEELSLRAATTSAVVPVYSTARADWAQPGQRVVVRARVGDAYQTVEAVIQSTTSNTITLDTALGSVGTRGASIMPTLPVYLDPQQGFSRYVTPDGVEMWNVSARLATAGFVSSPVAARLPLTGLALSGALDGLTIVAREPGTAGNSITVAQTDDSPVGQGVMSENLTTKAIALKYRSSDTTVGQWITLVNGSTLVRVIGTAASTSATLPATQDVFSATALSGGLDATYATWGLTQTLTTFLSSPVWTKGIDVHDTADDSAQSMAEVQDLGGLPFASPSATMPDWGRRITFERARGSEWQWVKKFLSQIAGRWKSFWLPTMRPDLVPVSKAAGTLTVESGESDVFAWWPEQREHLMTRLVDGTVAYHVITDAVDNHDGTVTLSLEDELGAAVTLASVPELVCWLERCRLESDEVQVSFRDARFSLSMLARAVQQDEESAPADTFLRDEGSVEEGQAREGIEISYGSTVHRIATGTRDVTIDGDLYEAAAAGRGEIKVTDVNDSHDEVQIHLPASHAFCQRWLAGYTPPQLVTVVVRRQQALSGEFVTEFVGEVFSLQPQGHTCIVRVISTFSRALLQRLPSLTVARTCPHLLGDDNCGVDLEAIKVTTTVTSFSGRTITVASMGGHPSAWAEGGKVVHTASGEVYSVSRQTSSDVELQFPIYGLAIGDSVQVYPGCTKLVSYCLSEFNNVANFGNPPLLPVTNPMRATGFGVIRS